MSIPLLIPQIKPQLRFTHYEDSNDEKISSLTKNGKRGRVFMSDLGLSSAPISSLTKAVGSVVGMGKFSILCKP